MIKEVINIFEKTANLVENNNKDSAEFEEMIEEINLKGIPLYDDTRNVATHIA